MVGAVNTDTPAVILTTARSGIGMIRSLGRLGIPVFIVDDDPRGPTSHSQFLTGSFGFDIADAEPDAAVDYLIDVGRRFHTRPVLIPTWDEAAVLVSDFADTLEDVFLFPRQPDGLPRTLANKEEMARTARRHGVPTPDVSVPSGIEDVRRFAADATFPVMLKGIYGSRSRQRTGHTVLVAQDPDQLLQAYQEMEDPTGPNLMLQEYIPGGEDTVWMFDGYFDDDSECLFGITARKLRQTPIHTGSTSLGVCEDNPVVDATTRRWMKELGYRGILDIGYRYDDRDGTYKVLDVNPRIGATFRLFVADNGMDVVRALYLDLTGQEFDPGRPVAGRKWISFRDFDTALKHWRAGNLTPRQYLRSLVGVRETSQLAVDDPAPILHVIWLWLSLDMKRRSRLLSSAACKVRARSSRTTRSKSETQAAVNRCVRVSSEKWRDVHRDHGVRGIIFRDCSATALAWIDELRLRRGTSILAVGCGEGLTSVALAERGLDVTAADACPDMIELTKRSARDRDVSNGLRAIQADAHDLPFEGDGFELVLALGLAPGLHSPTLALAELARVIRPGGYVLASADNAFRLNHLLDPRLSPLLAGPRRVVKMPRRRARRVHRSPGRSELPTPGRFRQLFEGAGLHRVREATRGFGPFTFLLHPVFSDADGIRLHRALQASADRGAPLLTGVGAHHLILAQRPATSPAEESPR